MKILNSPNEYGLLAKLFHWVTFGVLIAQAIYKSSVQENFQENFQDNSCRQAPQLDWWDENPVRSIISRSSCLSIKNEVF